MIHDLLKEFTDKELALKTGYTISAVNMVRKGKRRPSPEFAAKLEAITGIPLRVLLGLEEASEDPALGAEQRGSDGRESPQLTHRPEVGNDSVQLEQAEIPPVSIELENPGSNEKSPILRVHFRDKDGNPVSTRLDLMSLGEIFRGFERLFVRTAKEESELRRKQLLLTEGESE